MHLTTLATTILLLDLQFTTAALRNPFTCDVKEDCKIACPNDWQHDSPAMCKDGKCLCLIDHEEVFDEESCWDNPVCGNEYNNTLIINQMCYCEGGEPIIEAFRHCQQRCKIHEFGIQHDESTGLHCVCHDEYIPCEADNIGLCNLICYVKGYGGHCNNENRCICEEQ